jgi:hypothetical protein
MTARATGRERAMGEEREMTGRNRNKVLKFRDEAGVQEFEKRAEEFEVSQVSTFQPDVTLIPGITKS